jgi:hypothetical protein
VRHSRPLTFAVCATHAQIWYFNPASELMRGMEAEEEFYSKLCLTTTICVFARKESIDCDNMLVVDRGLISRSGRIGMTVVGEDMIITEQHLRDMASATALTSLVQVYQITKADLDELLRFYPRAARLVRKAAVRITFQRTVLKTAEFVKMNQEGTGSFMKRYTSMFDAFRDWHASHGRRILAPNEVRSGVEKRVHELDVKLESLSSSVNARFDELLAAVGNAKRLGAAAKKGVKGGKGSPSKSAPPPLPRSKPPPVPPRAPSVPLPVTAPAPGQSSAFFDQPSPPMVLSQIEDPQAAFDNRGARAPTPPPIIPADRFAEILLLPGSGQVTLSSDLRQAPAEDIVEPVEDDMEC